MTISPAVLEIARRYDIKVEVTSGLLHTQDNTEKGIHVFLRAGLSFSERKVWLTEDSPTEAQLHEVMHLITHPPGCRLNIVRENFMLMQVEREFARTMLSYSEFKRVINWQQETAVNDDDELFENGRAYWRDRDLWSDGYRRAQRVGLLDRKRKPTFERAVWPKDPVKFYFRWSNWNDSSHAGMTIEDVRA